MRFINNLCPPAYLYLLYSTIHVALDVSFGMYVTAFIKVLMAIGGAIVLDVLCGVELGIVAWAIVATPFIIMALTTSIAMGLGIDRLVGQAVKEKFSVLTADNKKNRDKYVTTLKQQDALPLSSSSMY
jgi:hypothetical protein